VKTLYVKGTGVYGVANLKWFELDNLKTPQLPIHIDEDDRSYPTDFVTGAMALAAGKMTTTLISLPLTLDLKALSRARGFAIPGGTTQGGGSISRRTMELS